MNDENHYKELTDEVKAYMQTRYNLLRMELLEKTSRIVALVLFTLVATCLALAALGYFSMALLVWLSTIFGSIVEPICIVGGGFLILLCVVYLARKTLFVNPIVRQLSKIMFQKNKKQQHDE